MLNLKDKDFKDLVTLKGAINIQLKKRKISINGEISEDLLKEIFYETKERMEQKTKYEVDKFDFPKNCIFAWFFLGKDYRQFRRFLWRTMSEEELRKTMQVWGGEYPEEESFTRSRVKNFSISLNKGFFFIVLKTRRRDSLRHELTHYFEGVLELEHGSLLYIWE